MKLPWRNIVRIVLYIVLLAIIGYVFGWVGVISLTVLWLIDFKSEIDSSNNNENIMEIKQKVWISVPVHERLPKLVEDYDTKSKVVVILIEEIVPEGGEYYGDKRCDLIREVPNLAFYRKHLGWCWAFGDQIVPSVSERIRYWLEEHHNSCVMPMEEYDRLYKTL